jgi:alpha-glucosidase
VGVNEAPFVAVHAAVPELFEDRGAHLWLRIRTRGPRPLRAHVRTEPDHEERLTPLVAEGAPDARGWTTWEAGIPVATHEATTRYAFRFVFADHQTWLAADGLHPGEPDPTVHFRHVAGHAPADWVWDAVFYQVFPDRFRNGDPANDPQDGAWSVGGEPIVRRAWSDRPTRGMGPREFFGGDLQGVRDGLGHVADLGANALYLNPVFTSPSSHKYDTVDYARVDPHLGGDEALRALLDETRRRGVRVLLDAVVNHTSERHPWFEEARAGVATGSATGTRDHYVFPEPVDPDRYVGWAGVRTLPVLDFASAGVRAKVYEGDDAILRRWLRPPWAIDGWRLDVIHMLGEGAGAQRNHAHVAAMRQAIRAERADAYVLGEHFFDATAWLQGHEEDGAMNYAGFLRPMLAFWAGIDFRGDPERCDAAELDRRLARTRARLPWPVALSQFNLLSSHDVPRFLTRVGGDVDAFLAAHHALFAYVGAPSVYYGDEVGLEGGEDPDNRRPMPWSREAWNPRVFATVRRLAHLRRSHPALARGRYATLLAQGDVFAFARVLDGEAVVCALHRRGGRLRLPIGALDVVADWTDALTGARVGADGEHLELDLPAGRAGACTLVSRADRVAPLPPLEVRQ